MMCDGSWEDVQGELEGAASSCESYLPANNWQGLINLFGYYEAVPECEWSSARSSLTGLAGALERVEEELMSSIRFADQDYIQETKLYYDMVLGKLRRAGDLFLPGRLCCVDSGRYGAKICAYYSLVMPSIDLILDLKASGLDSSGRVDAFDSLTLH